MRCVADLEQPIVRRPTALKFKSAERVGDVLQGVHNAVGVVVGGVHTPLLPCLWMGHIFDAVRYQVKHVVILIFHILLHPAMQCPG